MTHRYDFAVIGAGVVGSAIARMLAGTVHTVALLDARSDVCEGTSKANTSLLHTGYDAKPGTLEARLVRRGYELTRAYCEAADIGFQRTGAILVAWDEEQAASLPSLQAKAVENHYGKTKIIGPDAVYEALPKLGPGVCGGLTVPDEGVVDAWTVPLALATDAANRGAALLLGHAVRAIEVAPDATRIRTNKDVLEATWVINAAGLGGDVIDAMFGYDRLQVHPRKGELLVFDKLASRFADKIVLAAPSKAGKGVLISPTIFGNIMLGPTADDMEDKEDTSTTEQGLAFLLKKGARIMPELLKEEVTAAYAGLRAAHNQQDYLIELDDAQRYVIAGAIRSTGLTSAMAVAEYVQGLLAEAGINVAERDALPDPPTMAPIAQSALRPFEDDALIRSDPAYGEVVCFCERVTRGEIRDALRSTIPATTMNGLRRRTRATNGRCQGFFCGAEVRAQFDQVAGESK